MSTRSPRPSYAALLRVPHARRTFAWSSPTRARLPYLAAGLGVCLAAAGLAPGLGTLLAAVMCAGLFVAPALTTAYLLADESAAPGFRVRAGTWCNTAVNAGGSAGAAAVGLLVERLPLPVCFAVSGAVAAAAALVPGRRRGGSARREGPISRRPSHESRRSRPSPEKPPSRVSGRP